MNCKSECCCNCKHQITLQKHPFNKDFGKGSISESCGYVCTAVYEDGSNEGTGVYSDKPHGLCELHVLKK